MAVTIYFENAKDSRCFAVLFYHARILVYIQCGVRVWYTEEAGLGLSLRLRSLRHKQRNSLRWNVDERTGVNVPRKEAENVVSQQLNT